MSIAASREGTRFPGLNGAALILLLGLGAVWCVQAIGKAERSTGNDLVGYLAASEALYSGGDPYHLPGRFPYIYPLFLAAVVRPLLPLGVRYASVLWFAGQCVCLWYVLRATRVRVGGSQLSGWAAMAIVVAVFGDVLQREFLNGQVNLLVLCLMVAAVRVQDSKRHLAPLLLGAAIALKLTPALLLVYWVMRRRHISVVEAVAWAAALALAPIVIVGERLWPLYRGYVQEFIIPRTGAPGAPGDGDIFFHLHGFWSWITGSTPGRTGIAVGAGALIVALALWHGRHPARRESTAAAWMYVAITPLLSPMSEVHHLVATMPLFAGSAVHWNQNGVFAALLLFAAFLWAGRFDRFGPWYFFALVCLIAAGLLAQRMRHAVEPAR